MHRAHGLELPKTRRSAHAAPARLATAGPLALPWPPVLPGAATGPRRSPSMARGLAVEVEAVEAEDVDEALEEDEGVRTRTTYRSQPLSLRPACLFPRPS